MKHLSMQIGGMSCGGCVAAVRNVLSRQPGISGLHVEVGKADFDYDESTVDLDQIAQTIRKAGYDPKDVGA